MSEPTIAARTEAQASVFALIAVVCSVGLSFIAARSVGRSVRGPEPARVVENGVHTVILERSMFMERGSMNPAAVLAVVKADQDAIVDCDTRARDADSAEEGQLQVRLIVAPRGLVSHAAVYASTLDYPVMEQCVRSRLLRMRFEPTANGEPSVLRVALRFGAR